MSCNVMSLTCSSYVQGDAQHTMSDQTSFVETICLACELYKGLWPVFWAYNIVGNALGELLFVQLSFAQVQLQGGRILLGLFAGLLILR